MIKTKIKDSNKNKIRKSAFVLFILFLALATIMSASNILALRVGNFEINMPSKETGQRFIERVDAQEIEALEDDFERLELNQNLEENNQFGKAVSTQARERVNSREVINFANQNEYITKFVRDYNDEYFCFETEERVEYIYIEDGKVVNLDYEPNRCYRIKTSEDFVSYAWDKGKNNKELTMLEIDTNVKIPLRLKAKMLVSKFNIFS